MASAKGRRPESLVAPKPWAITTHGRPCSPAKASPSPARCQAAQVSPWLGKETSLRLGSSCLRGQHPAGELRRHPVGGALTTGRNLVAPDVVLVDVPVDLHRVTRAIDHPAEMTLLVADDPLLHLLERGQRVLPVQVAADQLALQLDGREQGGDGLGEADEGQ